MELSGWVAVVVIDVVVKIVVVAEVGSLVPGVVVPGWVVVVFIDVVVNILVVAVVAEVGSLVPGVVEIFIIELSCDVVSIVVTS